MTIQPLGANEALDNGGKLPTALFQINCVNCVGVGGHTRPFFPIDWCLPCATNGSLLLAQPFATEQNELTTKAHYFG